MTGIELIAQERKEQIEKHGRTIEKDVNENRNKELRKGAQALLTSNYIREFPMSWDADICAKMASKSYKYRLIIAGALIAAEIDRIQALEKK